MSTFMYILQSQKTGHFYVGSANDLEDRMRRHNAGYMKATKARIPWEMIYIEEFENRELAVQREREIKAWKSAEAIFRLIEGY